MAQVIEILPLWNKIMENKYKYLFILLKSGAPPPIVR